MNRADAQVGTGSPQPTRVGENRAINVIRMLAALLVVIGHVRVLLFQDYAETQPSTLRALLYAPTSLGGSAVIVFFVLSGYWVGGGALAKLRAATFTWRGYAGSRLTRLWLVLIPALLLTLAVDQIGRNLRPAVGIYADGGTYAAALSSLSWSPATFLGNTFFLQSIVVDEFGTDKALWSLANEFWYYLIFPATVMVFLRAFSLRARITAAVLAVAGSIVAGPAILALFPAWLTGALVASQRDRIVVLLERTSGRALACARLCAVSATLAAMLLLKFIDLPSVLSALVIALPAAALVSLLVVDLSPQSRIGSRFLAVGSWMAGSSYSLYVIHLPLTALISSLLIESARSRWALDAAHVLLALAVVVLLIVLGVCFAAVTERRTEDVRALLRRSLSSPSRPRADSRRRPLVVAGLSRLSGKGPREP